MKASWNNKDDDSDKDSDELAAAGTSLPSSSNIDDVENNSRNQEMEPLRHRGGSNFDTRHREMLDFIKSDAAQSRAHSIPAYSKSDSPENTAWAKVQRGFQSYLADQRLVTYFPMLGWLKDYNFQKEFPNDLVAGLSVGIMVIPQGMSYAKLAGLPVEYGLYSALLPMLSYSIFGTSRQLCVGPVAIISLMLSTGLGKAMEAEPQYIPDTPEYEARYISLAIQTTFLVGLCTTFMGICRLGFTTVFLSHAVISGFTSGASVIIAMSQLKFILGITVPRADRLHEQLRDIFHNIDGFDWRTFVLGMIGILIHIVFKQVGNKVKSLNFIKVMGPITASVFGIVVVVAFDLAKKGIPIVKHIPQGLPAVTISEWTSITDLNQLVPVVATITIVGFMESIAIAKQLAAKHKYEVDASQELIGLGMSNFIGSMFSAYPVTGSFSRSAVKDQCGAQSNISGFVTTFVVGLVLLVLTDLFEKMPMCVLGAIVIAGVISLFDYEEAIYLYKVHKFDFTVWIVSCAATMFLGAEQGLGVAIGVSLLIVIYESAYPHTSILGRLPGTGHYRNVKQYPEAERYDGIVIARIDAPMYFANAQNVRETIRRYRLQAEAAAENKKEQGEAVPGVRFVILDMSPVSHIDTTALHILEDMHENHQSRGQQIVFCNPSIIVWERLVASGIADAVGRDHFFTSIHDAVKWCLFELHNEAVSSHNMETSSKADSSSAGLQKPAVA